MEELSRRAACLAFGASLAGTAGCSALGSGVGTVTIDNNTGEDATLRVRISDGTSETYFNESVTVEPSKAAESSRELRDLLDEKGEYAVVVSVTDGASQGASAVGSMGPDAGYHSNVEVGPNEVSISDPVRRVGPDQ